MRKREKQARSVARSVGKSKSRRSPERDMAFELWLASEGQRTLRDIASELNVSPEQVYSWKHADKWDAKTQKIESPDGKGFIVKRKQGGQLGNKNAIGNPGGHAPPGNKNGFRHGAYERVMGELLQGDEREVFEDKETGDHVEEELKRTLAALNAKEIRLVKRIERTRALLEPDDPAQLESYSATDAEKLGGEFTTAPDGRREKHPGTNSLDGEIERTIIVNTVSVFDALNKLEAELDRVHGRKIKVLSQLESLRTDRERLELDKKRMAGETEQNRLANAWISALLDEDTEEENEETGGLD